MTSHFLNFSRIKVEQPSYMHQKYWRMMLAHNTMRCKTWQDLNFHFFRAADSPQSQRLLRDQHATRPQLCVEEENLYGGGGGPVEGLLHLDPRQEEGHLEGSQETPWTCPLT